MTGVVLEELIRRYRMAVIACGLSAVPTQYHTFVWLALHVVSSLFVAWLLCQAGDHADRWIAARVYGQPKTLHSSRRGRGQRPGPPPRIT